jgi:transcriptional regulator with XRE-family HTH domain
MTTHGDVLLAQLGLEFKYWRLERGLTQEQLAAKAKVSISTLRRIEESGPVKYDHAIAISVALDIPLAVMQERAEEAVRIKERGSHEPDDPGRVDRTS